MELNSNLENLIERGWALHDEVSDRIHGHSCGVAETPLEREKLVAIRDSLNNVENMLVCLQRLDSWQQRDRNAAIMLLEESRLILMEKVAQYKGRSLDVIEELNAYFSDVKTTHNWNLKRMMEKLSQHRERKGNSHFLVQWIWSFLNPWNWHHTARVAVKLILVSASVSYTLKFCKNRQEIDNSQRKIVSLVDSTRGGKRDFTLAATKSNLDVFYGRG